MTMSVRKSLSVFRRAFFTDRTDHRSPLEDLDLTDRTDRRSPLDDLDISF